MQNMEVIVEHQMAKSIEKKKIEFKKNYNYRDLLEMALIKRIDLVDINLDLKFGDISFAVTIESLGMSYKDLAKYKSEVYSHFFTNTFGEILVRENLEMFAELLINMEVDRFAIIGQLEHKHFGLDFHKDRFIFSFHASLLQSLLTESFTAQMQNI